jgi:4-coumarate--CoA ligase
MIMQFQLNQSSFDADGWMHTGDLGFFDDQSNIYVLERLTFVYKHMFHFVSPTEVESLLLQHPDVFQAGVVGVPDAESEALGRAFIVKRPGSKCSESDLVQFVAERAPFFKHLHKGVRFVDELPQGLAGKINRMALKKLALEELHQNLY